MKLRKEVERRREKMNKEPLDRRTFELWMSILCAIVLYGFIDGIITTIVAVLFLGYAAYLIIKS